MVGGYGGSGLARDSIAAVCQPDRVVCIASKPAPTPVAPMIASPLGFISGAWQCLYSNSVCGKTSPHNVPRRPLSRAN
ncbi:hypothetical protein F7Q95_15905 [Pseudomonas psychrophila]|nr:hypothetical protein F7Q95_15905 [Pseudomonas psychrophila]